MNRTMQWTLLGGAVLLATACGGEGVSSERTATTEAALGEIDCAYVRGTPYPNGTNGARLTYTQPPSCGYESLVSTSPGATYDNVADGYTCSNQYITEVGDVATKPYPISFIWSWAGPTLTQSNCSYAWATIAAYGRVKGTSTWNQLGSAQISASWVSGPLFSYCQFTTSSNTLQTLAANQNQYDTVRTATEAGLWLFKQRVAGGIMYGPGPCAPQTGG